MKKILLFLSVPMIISFLACSKDQEAEMEIQPSVSIVGDWKTLSLMVDEPDEASRDAFREFDPCQHDDIMSFGDDLMYVRHEGETGCGVAPNTVFDQGSYTLADNKLTMTSAFDPSETYTYDISLTSSTLTMTIQMDNTFITLIQERQ